MGSNGLIGTTSNLLFGKAPKIQAPEARSYLKEMQSALSAQGDIQGRLLELEGQYTPLWQQQQQQSLIGGMQSINNLYKSAIPMSEQLGLSAMGSMAPAYAQAGQTAMGAYSAMMSPEARNVYSLMGQQAQQGLEAGYGLTDQQSQYAQQAARAALAARGISTGNQAVAAEVLGSYGLSNQRYQQNLANAQNYVGTSQNIAGNAFNMYGQPLMSQLNQFTPSSILATAGAFNEGLGSKLFQPESQYNANIISANQSNQMQTAMANQQIKAARQAGNMQLVASLAKSGVDFATG
jgi:hypothetical protein